MCSRSTVEGQLSDWYRPINENHYHLRPRDLPLHSVQSAVIANAGDTIGLRIFVANREDEGFVVAGRWPVNDFTTDYGAVSGAGHSLPYELQFA
jgi:hypothetical protein